MIIRFAAVFVGVLFLIFLAPSVLAGDLANLAPTFLGIAFLVYGIFGKDLVSPKKK